MGAEIVAADIDDVESLKKAFHCAHAVYCVTPFWEHFSPERELAQAKNMADAAKQDHVGHVVWSTLEDTRGFVPLEDDRMPTLMGRYKVPHFDAKGEADRYLRRARASRDVPADVVLLGELHLFRHGAQEAGPDGELGEIAFPMGDAKLAGIAVRGHRPMRVQHHPEPGGVPRQDRRDRRRSPDREADGRGGSPGRWAGRSGTTTSLRRRIARWDFPARRTSGTCSSSSGISRRIFCGARDLAAARRLHPGMKTFDEWLSENRDRIPIEERADRRHRESEESGDFRRTGVGNSFPNVGKSCSGDKVYQLGSLEKTNTCVFAHWNAYCVVYVPARWFVIDYL